MRGFKEQMAKKQGFEEESFDDSASKEEVDIESEDELSTAEEGFLRGYEQELDDPFEEKEVVEEEIEY